ncbi:MAG: ammonium transporter [Acidothermus sp.]|nr:ammonium transporter [Acidothermus sp.]MCL6538772.1 ammonium transporter [Acidothermus sp.]
MDPTTHVNWGNTAWMLTATALVLLMTPGLAFFYGGMVRAKNVLAMLMQNFICMGIVSVLWVIDLFSIAFGPDTLGGFIGDAARYFGLHHGADLWSTGNGVPTTIIAAFQITFAIITAALITGAVADRLKFAPFIVFVTAWSILVYAPIAHWVWGGGWLAQHSVEDFAGGTVVHINAGAAGVALTLVLGRRIGWPNERMRPHNVPFVLLGAGLLWFGWLGFNAGSELAADQVAGYALVNTIVATAAAMLGWLVVERIRDGHPTTLGAASGLVAGLVAITPACAFVSPLGAIVVGAAAGVLCALAVSLKFKARIDDSLDVFAVHLIGGVVGALSIGFLGDSAINSAGHDGLFYGGGFLQLGRQAMGVFSVLAYDFVVTFLIAKAIDKVMGLRVSRDVELEGLDINLHAESAYDFGAPATHATTPVVAAARTKVDA